MSNGIIKSSVLLVVAGACAVCALLLWVVGGGCMVILFCMVNTYVWSAASRSEKFAQRILIAEALKLNRKTERGIEKENEHG